MFTYWLVFQGSDINVLSKESNRPSQKLVLGADYMRKFCFLTDCTKMRLFLHLTR